ncbi:MAG TPA: hypothetical protein VGG62_17720 [Terracidiphilus sp.]|jgi:hypothetical protein
MPMFQARITHTRLSFSPFASESMMIIGQVVLDHIKARIQSVKDVTDSQAKPLKESYAEQKRQGRYVVLGGPKKYSGLPVRDWTLRGRTMQSLKVKVASEERVTIGPTSQETTMIVLARNKKDKMWGLSPSDYEALYTEVRSAILRTKVIRVIKGKAA